jgi:DoxX-like family
MQANRRYWICTGLLMAWLAVGGAMDLARAAPMREIMRTLHYPDYLLFILGSCKLAAVAALAQRRWLLIREWAYAGVTINCLGAFVSHLMVRDHISSTVAPLIMLAIAAGSYALLPRDLRLNYVRARTREEATF